VRVTRFFNVLRPQVPGRLARFASGRAPSMHPTRQAPTDHVLWELARAACRSDASRSRPGGPSRQAGQALCPRGVKEGPMKGYVPPPRMVVSNEPLPITRTSRSQKASALRISLRSWKSGPRISSRACSRAAFLPHQSNTRRGTGRRDCPLLRGGNQLITFEEQAAKGYRRCCQRRRNRCRVTPRPPVVTIMGHVDHGKHPLDSIRLSSWRKASRGITQHIGGTKYEFRIRVPGLRS